MDKVVIVKILDTKKYNPYVKPYGILQDVLDKSAVINFSSNRGGLCINVSHGDYEILPEYLWDIIDGEVIIRYVRTGLNIRE